MNHSELYAGFEFDSEEHLLSILPDVKRWVLVRKSPLKLYALSKLVENDRGFYWWAAPVGDPTIEVLVCGFTICESLKP